MRPWILIALLLCLLASQARADHPALAPPKTLSARSHFTQGNRHYRVRKLDEAIAAYQAGAVIEPAPVFDYNLGQCYRKLGRHADAIWHYERFLRNGRPEGELHALVTGFLRELRSEPERKALVPPGSGPDRKASVRPPSEQAQEQEQEQQQQPQAVVPPPAARAAWLRPPAGSSAARSPSAPSLSVSAVARGDRWYADRLGWGLAAAGVTAAVGAGYLLSHAVDLQHEAAASLAQRDRLELRGRARVHQLAGAALGVGGGALLATGVIKLALRPRAPTRASAAAWSIGISGLGVAVLGRF